MGGKEDSKSKLVPPLIHLASGIVGGSIATVLLYPLQLINTRLQVQGGGVSFPGATAYRSTTHAFITILKHESPRVLYQGLTPALIGAGFSWGSYFYLYSMAKRWIAQERIDAFELKGKSANHQNAVHNAKSDVQIQVGHAGHVASAMIAGAITAFMINPVFVVKTRMQLQNPNDPNKYHGLRHAFANIYKEEGLLGFYKGFVPALFGVTHGAVQFLAYETLKVKIVENRSNKELSGMEGMFSGGLSKVIATISTYPYQLMKSRLQMRPNTEGLQYTGVIDVAKKIYLLEGFKGYFRGCLLCIIRTTPGSALTLGIYEATKSFLLKVVD